MSITISPTRTASRARNPHESGAASDSVPADFDPGAHPILALHFFGVRPLHRIGGIAANVMVDLKRQRQVARLHSLGSRPASLRWAQYE